MGIRFFLENSLETNWLGAIAVVVTAVCIYGALLIFTRLAGLRSFSKISSFDFATTVAMGSLLATVIVAETPPLLQGLVGLGMLFGLQFAISYLRSRLPVTRSIIDNQPLLLMDGERVLEENLTQARLTMADLRAKLREANVIHFGQIKAVVMESTGDITVLHTDSDTTELDPGLLQDVRGTEHP